MRNTDVRKINEDVHRGFQDSRLFPSGSALHLAVQFGRSLSHHGWRHAALNDQPNCFASYTAFPGFPVNVRAKQY